MIIKNISAKTVSTNLLLKLLRNQVISTQVITNINPVQSAVRQLLLHHDYEYYYNLKCCDKTCNHSFNLPGKTNFKGMRHAPHLIVMALYHYFHQQSSTRKVSTYLKDFYNVKVSHVTIADWTKKFAPLFKLKSEKILPDNLNHSDEWHVDETVVKIKGQ